MQVFLKHDRRISSVWTRDGVITPTWTNDTVHRIRSLYEGGEYNSPYLNKNVSTADVDKILWELNKHCDRALVMGILEL